MYTLVSAIGVPIASGSRWVSIDIGNIAMITLFQSYRRVIATLTNPAIKGQVGLDLDQIRTSAQGLNISFNGYLASIGQTTLPTLTKIPQIAPVYATYADVFHAGYDVTPIGPYQAIDAPLPSSDKTWLKITKAASTTRTIDFNLLYKSCLVSVNGFFHFIETDGTGIYVREGDVSRQRSLQNQVGLMGFRALGALTYVNLTSSMLYKPLSTVPYKYRAYFDMGQSVLGKTPMLVLGGYLHVLDNKTFYQVGETTFCIEFENYPLLQRYYESGAYLDLSSLPLPKNSVNGSQVGVDDIESDANIQAMFDLSQTFMVLLDTTELFTDRQYIRKTPMPGMYVTALDPVWPIITGYGRSPEYWYTKEDTDFPQYSITIKDAIKANYVFTTTGDPNELQSVSSQLDPMNPGVLSDAYFRLIGRDVDVSGLLDPTS